MNNYYIYVWIREDYNTIFYVGKGKDYRATCKQGRSEYFLNIVNSIPTRMEKIYDNLTEEQAFIMEKQTLCKLVYEEGYSIDIQGFNKIKGKHLVNKTWGGEGSSGRRLTEEEKRRLSEIKTGVPNLKLSDSMKKYYKTHDHPNAKKVVCLNTGVVYSSISNAEKETGACSSVISENCNGNASYAGKIMGEALVWMKYEDFLKAEEEFIKDKLERGKEVASKQGKENSFYGRQHSEETKQKLSDNWTKEKVNNMINKQKCNRVYCVELQKEFISQGQASRYILETFNVKLKGQTIGKHCSKGKESKGYGEIMLNGELVKLHWVFV